MSSNEWVPDQRQGGVDNPYALVEVVWWDHWHSADANVTPWEAERRAHGAASLHSSVGYLVGESDEQYLLTETVSYWVDGEVDKVRGYRGILKNDVIEIRALA